MPEPISRASPKPRAVEPAERLGQLQPHLLLAGGAEVDAPLGVVFVGGRVVVAGVDVLDVLRRGGRRGWHRRGTLRTTVHVRVEAEYLQENQPRRGAAAAADRRADAARRARGELLVPAPPGRLRVDRRAGRRQAGRRHGLRRGLRLGRAGRRGAASVVGVDANPEAHEHARLRYVRAQPALRARPGRELRGALRRGRLPADDRARPGRGRDPRALQVDARRRRRRLRLDPEPADPGAAGGGEVRQPLARQGVPAPRSSASSARPTSRGSSCSASSTPASCASTSSRSSSAGTASTSASA